MARHLQSPEMLSSFLLLLLLVVACLSSAVAQRQSITLCGMIYGGSCRAACNEGGKLVVSSYPTCPSPNLCCRAPPSGQPTTTAPETGKWGQWGAWSVCGGVCGYKKGTQSRLRVCQSPDVQCAGEHLQSQPCSRLFCFQFGYWGQWSLWGACSNQCGRGQQHRRRQCLPPAVASCMVGSPLDTRTCQNRPCSAAPAAWSHWSTWSTCSRTCGPGTRERTRTCPTTGSCEGTATETSNCSLQACQGDWGGWTAWSDCSRPCGFGFQSRRRTCLPDGLSCVGQNITYKFCIGRNCGGQWEIWAPWGDCSVTCGNGSRSRTRKCKSVGVTCTGSAVESAVCNTQECEGVWSPWSPWNPCSSSCGGGSRSRQRACQPSGAQCPGNSTESAQCGSQSCPGVWSPWSPWNPCSSSCGGGSRSRRRACQPSGAQCPGNSTESAQCGSQPCPGVWSPWSPWNPCSSSCGGGSRSRRRACQPSGAQCPGNSTESAQCGSQPCPGTPGPWGQWGTCSTSCGLGTRARSRSCLPSNAVCSEPTEESRACFDRPCESCGLEGPRGRILGGRETVPCRWPWMANLRLTTVSVPNSPHLTVCGGVLLDSNSLLTTAVCADYLRFTEAAGVVVDVVVGEHRSQELDAGQQVLPYASLKFHPNYTSLPPEQFPNTEPRVFVPSNLAVVQLEGEVTPGECRREICLPDPWHQLAARSCVIAGWGRTSKSEGFTAAALREANVTLLPAAECERLLSEAGLELPPGGLGDDFLCTNSPADGAAACEGDEGGALMCLDTEGRWTVQGLVSDYRCDPRVPIVFPRVAPGLYWVRDVIRQND